MQKITHVKEEAGGIRLHSVKTNKYKTNTIVVKMKAPLNEQDATMRALLPYVLQSGTETFPTSTKIRSRLDDLYGATLSVDLSKKGDYHIISFRMEVANGEYLQENAPLLEQALELLSEILLKPALESGAFSGDIVSKEKRAMKQRLQSMKDDKMRYASIRLIEEMCKNEPYGTPAYGNENDLDGISPESLFAYYQTCLKDNEIDLYIVGNTEMSRLKELAARHFQFGDRSSAGLAENAEADTVNAPSEPKEVIDSEPVNQGKLNMGFRAYTTYKDDDYFALQLFNGIFGGFSHSKLFINVREKASLAYYAASRLESHKGFILVMSGIEFGNYNQAVTIIKEQMELMKQGEFSDEDISQTKAVIRNQLLETADSAGGLIEVLYHEVVAGKERPFEQWLEGVAKVTREDIIRVAEKIDLDTVYFLKGTEGE
ncbi:EF-P 5-aminopentanol modification-associated protein YfmF [Bacillus marinisedimentorum]|uniref:EF-P 5-aminopentanol modification-associated protein YfmF n=1 Tax=Bacillus marinisedimentorum TaxID=1821260 RepID=UPI0007E066DE|nr:pitrilysin family protein [Bacillus marinisedimentorum]